MSEARTEPSDVEADDGGDDAGVFARLAMVPTAAGLVRVAALVEYDGTQFAGLQWQDNAPSIQGEIERVLKLMGVDDAAFRAAGRTDAGVHARGQVVALWMPQRVAGANAVGALNWHLPTTIRVRRVAVCDPAFDPRRDAIRRAYRYLLCAGQPTPPLMRDRMGHVPARLDLEMMRGAAQAMRGAHDFRAWRSTQCQAKRTHLDMELATVAPWAEAAPHGLDGQCFEVRFECRSFLHRMVRFLVGGIVRVGSGELSVDDLRRHLDAATLPPRVVPAPAAGLSLERVDYRAGRDPFGGGG